MSFFQKYISWAGISANFSIGWVIVHTVWQGENLTRQTLTKLMLLVAALNSNNYWNGVISNIIVSTCAFPAMTKMSAVKRFMEICGISSKGRHDWKRLWALAIENCNFYPTLTTVCVLILTKIHQHEQKAANTTSIFSLAVCVHGVSGLYTYCMHSENKITKCCEKKLVAVLGLATYWTKWGRWAWIRLL